MAEDLHITLPYGYRINEQDVGETKSWMRKRTANAMYLASSVERLIDEAIKKIVTIAYKYNVKPEEWHLSANKELFKEIQEVMDELEEEIYDEVLIYSTNTTESKKEKIALIAWLILLHSKNTKNLRDTLHIRLHQFLYDTEAQIAAMMLAGKKQTEAISRIISTKKTVYSSPEMLAAFDKRTEASYIRLRGVHPGNVGLSSSGALNVINFAKQTAVLGWMRALYRRYKEKRVDGFYVLRGSNFDCPLCDSFVGFHEMDKVDAFPPYHNACCCYVIPVYQMTQQELIKSQIE